ncbi:MAG: FecR family protein [bacterium]
MENIKFKNAAFLKCCVVFIQCCLISVAAFAARDRRVILSPGGTVEVRAGGKIWETDKAVYLQSGHEVHTRADSSADMVFSDGSRIHLAPSTEFAITASSRKESVFSLKMGKIKAAFAGFFSSKYTVKTQTAVCAVRGTEFEIVADQAGATELNVQEGLVELRDNAGREAVVSPEESVKITQAGMEPPRLISLSDSRAREAAAPQTVRRELARDQTRAMMEELRNRELKANEAQLGKDAIDAFGKRVRLEEYILRPNDKELKFLFLSHRDDSLNWGHLIERFQNNIPDDYSKIPAIVAATYFSPTMPKNWLKYFEMYLTNTIDSIKETITLGAPTLVNFSGYGTNVGTRYYPRAMDYQQILTGPGVPGGERTQFQLIQIYAGGRFTWRQQVINNAGVLDTLILADLDPTKSADVEYGASNIYVYKFADPNVAPSTSVSFPSGPGKADYLVRTKYGDGSWISSRKMLVSNEGDILGIGKIPNADTFLKEGSYNAELVVASSLFQGRKIDVLIAPEIFSQKKAAGSYASAITPQ